VEDDTIVSSNTRPDADKDTVSGIRSGKNVKAVGVKTTTDDRIYTINDLPELIIGEEIDIITDIFQAERHRIKFGTQSKGTKKREMEDLRNMLWDTYYELGKRVWPMKEVGKISRLCYIGNS
tara:strand:+ start:377 stop:742 length:366 start_codon:yes stop_codon:yes gene_type:complete